MIYFMIGIKGSGMASLAQILLDQGHEVSGSDIDQHIFTEDILKKRNVEILNFNQDNIKEDMIIVVGNSFDESHIEVAQAIKLNLKRYTYVGMLAKLIKENNSFCIAGTHGKTTCTGLVTSVLNIVEPTGYLIGDGHGQLLPEENNFVVESCEYKDNYLNYFPNVALINNVELDHVDYFKSLEQYIDSFKSFANNVSKYLVLNGDDKYLKNFDKKDNYYYFGTEDHNDFQAKNIEYSAKGISFDLYHNYNKNDKKLVKRFNLALFGKHMLYNALAAISIFVLTYGEDYYEELEQTLSSFKGVARRFDIIEGNNGNIFIDDYAHHPTAINLMIESTKQKYPDKEIIAFFKPDRYSRIFKFGQEIGEALSNADQVYLFEFPLTSPKEEGIDISMSYVAQYLNNAKIINEDLDTAVSFKDTKNSVFLMMSSKNVYDFRSLIIANQ